MSGPEETSWSRQMAQVGMSGTQPDDFSSFLDINGMDGMDGFDLSIPAFLDSASLDPEHDGEQAQNRSDSRNPGRRGFGTLEHYGDEVSGHFGNKTSQQTLLRPAHGQSVDHTGYDIFNQKHSNFQWLQDQPFQHQPGIPPTPNSTELYPAQYPHQNHPHPQQGSSYQHLYFRPDDTLAMYTPHESPQCIGSEGSFSVPDFAVPGTYSLSPLTSPAMQPQLSSSRGMRNASTRTAESSLAGSPVDLDFDIGEDLASPSTERPRKTRRRTAALRSSAAQSSSGRNANVSGTRKRKSSVNQPQPTPRSGTDASGNDLQHIPTSGDVLSNTPLEVAAPLPLSLSPTPIPESSMAPPPKPNSVKSTPTIQPQSKSTHPPATPASLMRLPPPSQSEREADLPTFPEESSPSTDLIDSGMQELQLPEAAAAPPTSDPDFGLSKRSNHVHGSKSVGSTPKIGSQTPGGLSLQTDPQSLRPKTSTHDTKSAISARTPRKRNSTASNLVSPALRPRISPSIKPLLPDGAKGPHSNITDETHALLLASKSNYQNLLEGNQLPGVNYPSDLSSNLTSKRTSHKIAEQGRRNRINTALIEMQSLLPSLPSTGIVEDTGKEATSPDGNDAGGKGDSIHESAAPAGSKTPLTPGSAANSSNSKAATVEHAINHIKKINKRLEEREAENAQLKKEVLALRAKLEEGSGTSNNGEGEMSSGS